MTPRVLILDVNQTLSDTAPMAEAFEAVGAPGHLAVTWFTSVLRDGIALTAAGANPGFADVMAGRLRVALAGVGDLDRPVEDAVEHLMAAFRGLGVHADVPSGLTALAEAGHRLVTLSNGAASVAEELLDRAGLASYVQANLSVADAPRWKPAAASYHWACGRLDVAPGEAMMVAAHAWDVDGAVRAGLDATFVDRDGGPWPTYLPPAPRQVASLDELAEVLTGRAGR